MKSVIKKNIILLITILSAGHTGSVFSETTEKEIFPDNIIVEYNNEKIDLSLTGIAIRKKFFLKIYRMAHYLEQNSSTSFSDDHIYSSVLKHSGAKQISMVFLRSLTAKQIQDSLITGLKLNMKEEEYLQILPNVEIFMRAIYEDVKENDEFVIRWHPDGTMVSLFQGKEISSIKDENFAKALWSIWFGDFSVVDRDLLIKELLTSS